MAGLQDRLANVDQRMAQYRFLTGNMVKVIAVLTMFIDHFTKIVFEWCRNNIWRNMLSAGLISASTWDQLIDISFQLIRIGRIAFPLFAFLLTEGFCYTRNRKRYAISLAAFALISELPFDLGFFYNLASRRGTFPFFWEYQNVFFTLLLGLGAMWCIEKFHAQSNQRSEKVKCLCFQVCGVAFMACIAFLIRSDYGAAGVLFITLFYITRENRIFQVLSFLLAYIISENSIMIGSQLMICLVILLYNGKRGKMKISKYACYVFYPTHILILKGMTLLLSVFAANS